MTQSLEAFQQALLEGADDDALDLAAADVRRDSGPAGLVEVLRLRISHELGRGKSDHDVTPLRFRLAAALEELAVAKLDVEGAGAAMEAATLYREVLNDGEAATRNLVHALRAAANDDATLKRAVEVAGGRELAEHVVERALKRKDVKEDASATAQLRRALARVAELGGDRERAFFEAMKAARKQPAEGLYIDEVFRLALDTARYTEAAAFFGGLVDDESLGARPRATLYNKLGQTLEKQNEKRAALEAYLRSLGLHEAKAPRRAVERLAAELGIDVDVPVSGSAPSLAPRPSHPPATEVLPPTTEILPPPALPRIARSEIPDVTPTYERPSPGDTTFPAPPAEPDEHDVTEDDVVEEKPRHQRAAAVTAPSDAVFPEITPHIPRPISVPPLPPADDGNDDRNDGGSVGGDDGGNDGGAGVHIDTDDDVALDAFTARRFAAPSPPSELTPTKLYPAVSAPSGAFDPPLSEMSLPPIEDAPVVSSSASSSSPDVALAGQPLEEALTRLPDRAARADEPTRRGITAGLKTRATSDTATAEGPSSKKKARGKKEKTHKTKPPQKEKTQKRKAPEEPSTSTTTTRTAPSEPDGAPMPSPSDAVPVSPLSPSPSPPSVPAAPSAFDDLASVPTHEPVSEPSWEVIPFAQLEEHARRVAAIKPEPRSAPDGAPPAPAPDAAESASAIAASPNARSAPGARVASPASSTPAESTDRAPSPAASTVEAMPPLVVPPMTVPSLETSSALALALEALESDDADRCTRAALDLAVESPAEPRVLRLAARALSLSAPSGQLPAEAVDLFVENAARHGERAAALALEVQEKLPPTTRRAYTHLWLAGAKAAGLDVARVLDLLRAVAVEEGPEGPAFVHAERVLTEVNDTAGRDALYLAALRSLEERGGGTDPSRAVLLGKRLALLEGQGRHADALGAHATLAIDVKLDDAAVRAAARRAHAERGTPDERARFLARLARKLPGDEGVDVVQELLEVRSSVDDRIGAEAAARDLLSRRPGDPNATRVLADLLADDPRRADELVDVLRVGAQQAMSWFGKTAEACSFLERLAVAQAKAGRPEEAADALVQVARLVPDDKNLERALVVLDEVKRHKEAVALLEEAAGTVADGAFRARTLLRAADIARNKLQKRGKSRELVERALEEMPRDKAALHAYADLLVEIGDADGAVTALKRLLVEEKDARPRASAELRMGRLLEEHLLKPDEALARYRSAAALDPSFGEPWAALRAIARQRGDRALLVDALRGLAGASSSPAERAALFSQLAKVERDERADGVAAERAFLEALSHAPGDEESLMGLLALLAARLQPDADLDGALAHPNDALLDAASEVILDAAEANGSLPRAVRRLEALVLSRKGERGAALARFEVLLAETPDDLATLLGLARHLAAAPRTEPGADARRLRCLETILLHHAYSLKPPVQVDVWGEVTALRAATGDGPGARKAAKKVMALAATDELKASLSDRAVRAVALALDDARDAERDPRSVVAAIVLDASRTTVDAEKSRLLERAAAVANAELDDSALARSLLEDAVRASPRSASARDALLDLDLSAGDVAGALKQVRDLLAREADPAAKASLHLRLFRLRKKLGLDPDGAAAELKAALDLDPGSSDVMDAAEQFFTERNDVDGLDKLWSAQLRAVDRGDVRARLKLLERLAQLRRYERRDLAAAVEALEAMTALDPDALKPREDAARLYTEMGMAREAVNAWRGVLERDPLVVEAWRGILERYLATRQGDEAFAVASTMLALELADDDIARATRTIRPPFPRWPIPPKDASLFRRKGAHPLERTPIRAVLDVVAPRLLPLYARSLKDFGIRRKDALADKNVPTSVLLAVRTLGQLLGLREPPPLFLAELGATDGQSPSFAALPSTEQGIIVTSDVLKGGMTPERAFALGRAAAWLQPHAVMASAVDGPTLRLILEGLVAANLGTGSLERPDRDAEQLGKDLGAALSRGLSSAEASALKAELVPALRDYVHARQQVQIADWRAGVGYSGDRVGFVMSTDLNAAFRVIKATAGSTQSMGARLAIKELVLFSVSPGYLTLRKDLGLAVPEAAAAPLLDLG